MRNAPVTRGDLRRALVLNALTKPLNVLVAAGLVVAALLLDARWLALVAIVSWLALVLVTFFDEREAKRVGERARAARREPAPEVRADPSTFTPAIAGRVRAAIAARAAIRLAVEDSRSPFDDVTREVDALVVAMQGDAARAQRIHEFLAEESPPDMARRIEQEPSAAVRAALETKLDALNRLQHRLDRLLAEMDHVVTTLQTVQAEILTTDGLEDGIEHGALAGQVSELRAKVQLMSAGLEDAFAETRVHGTG